MTNNKQLLSIFMICGIIMIAVMAAGCTQSSQSAPEQIKNTSAMDSDVNGGPMDSSQAALNDTGVTITDDKGNLISLNDTTQRIIVTNSDAAEILASIGAGDAVIGAVDSIWMRPHLGDHLPDAKNVGKWDAPDIEQIISLKPDVVVVYASSPPKYIDQLTAANISVAYLDLLDLNKVPTDARTLGKLTGHVQQAEDYASFIENYTRLVSDRTKNLAAAQRPDVYIESSSTYTTIGKGKSQDTLINLAGGNNLGATDISLNASAKVSAEWVITRNPDLIIKYRSNYSYTDAEMSGMRQEVMNRTELAGVQAVKNNSVYVFTGAVSYGPRSVIGLLYMAKIMQPGLFKDIDPGLVLDDYSKKFFTEANEGNFVYPNV